MGNIDDIYNQVKSKIELQRKKEFIIDEGYCPSCGSKLRYKYKKKGFFSMPIFIEYCPKDSNHHSKKYHRDEYGLLI